MKKKYYKREKYRDQDQGKMIKEWADLCEQNLPENYLDPQVLERELTNYIYEN